jgi:hypothetical protein
MPNAPTFGAPKIYPVHQTKDGVPFVIDKHIYVAYEGNGRHPLDPSYDPPQIWFDSEHVSPWEANEFLEKFKSKAGGLRMSVVSVENLGSDPTPYQPSV